MARISIVIPAHNAADLIEDTVRALESVEDDEIIVVCNNCSDNTFEKVEQLRKEYQNIVNLEFPFHTGKGGAVLRGFAHATGDVVGFVDADNAFYTSDVKRVIELTGRYDAVIASKWKDRGFANVRQPLGRRIYGRLWNLITRRMFGLDFMDTQAGLKFFKREALESIDKNFTCTGFEFDIELLYKVRGAGHSIHEVGVDLREGAKSTVGAASAVPMMWSLLRLWIRSRLRAYPKTGEGDLTRQ